MSLPLVSISAFAVVDETTPETHHTPPPSPAPVGPTLESLRCDLSLQIATRAHSGTSMVPETRGEQELGSYASTLYRDFQDLAVHAKTPALFATLVSEFTTYRQGYRDRTTAYLLAKARCLSSMITGPSNFPTRRNGKHNDAADKRCTELVEFRERALDAIRKVLRPELRPIMSGDANAPARLESKLAKREALQVQMKAANATIRKHAKAGPEAQVKALGELGFNVGRAIDLLKKDYAGRAGFPDYAIRLNGAEIRRLKGRQEEVAEAKSAPITEIKGEHATFQDAPCDNRVRLFFDGKPEAEVRTRLKSAAFRWTPSLGCWQAFRNLRSLDIAKRIAGVSEVVS